MDRAQERIAEGADIAADNMVESARYYNDFVKKVRKGEKMGQEPDRQLVDLGFKASREIGKSTGSLAGENTSIFIQNIYNTQINAAGDKAVRQIMDRLAETSPNPIGEGEVIDYEAQEEI